MNSRVAAGLMGLFASRAADATYIAGVSKRFKQARKMREGRRQARLAMQKASRRRNRA